MAEHNLAHKGDRILFYRHGFNITGEVVKERENSVIVAISSQDAEKIKIDTPYTVVSHNKYQMIS